MRFLRSYEKVRTRLASVMETLSFSIDDVDEDGDNDDDDDDDYYYYYCFQNC